MREVTAAMSSTKESGVAGDGADIGSTHIDAARGRTCGNLSQRHAPVKHNSASTSEMERGREHAYRLDLTAMRDSLTRFALRHYSAPFSRYIAQPPAMILS